MRLRLSVLVVAIALLVPTVIHAQEHMTVDINYAGGNFESKFDYPKEPGLVTGKSYETNGRDLVVEVRVSEMVRAGYRRQRNSLRSAKFLADFSSRGGPVVNALDLNHAGGASEYREVFGSFVLPKTHGHTLIIGLVKAQFRRDWRWEAYEGPRYSSLAVDHTGVVVGGSGKQKIGKVTLDYAGRIYPRLSRKDQVSSPEQKWPAIELSSSGHELRGTVTWFVAKHVGLVGGYQLRRLVTKMTTEKEWPINETLADREFIIGIRLSF